MFTSWGTETADKFTIEKIENCLKALDNNQKYGAVLRAKGIVPSDGGKWIHFDYVPEETNIRYGSSSVTGRLCVIGSKINEEELKKLFLS